MVGAKKRKLRRKSARLNQSKSVRSRGKLRFENPLPRNLRRLQRKKPNVLLPREVRRNLRKNQRRRNRRESFRQKQLRKPNRAKARLRKKPNVLLPREVRRNLRKN